MPQPVSFFDVEPLYASLQQGQLLLTSNQRLASRIRTAFLLASQQRSHTVVRTPQVFALNSWVEQQWNTLLGLGYAEALDGRLLDQEQELAVWERIVGDSPYGQALLRPVATAQQAASAYRLIVEWQLSLHSETVRGPCLADEDAAVWWQWANDFESHCQQHRLLCRAELPVHLLKAIERGELSTPKGVLLTGFQEITPLHRALLDQLAPVSHYQPDQPLGQVSVVQCASFQAEIQGAALWAKQMLKNDSNARIAIVVPELNQQRQLVERLLLEVFEPDYNAIVEARMPEAETAVVMASSRKAPPFNLSAGYSLLQAPVIKAAMDLLALARPQLPLETVEAICHSPFGLNAELHIDYIVQLLERCRAGQVTVINTSQLRQWAMALLTEGGEETDLWPFARALQQVGVWCRQSQITGRRTQREWLMLFEQLLEVMGWPGQRVLDSIEYQQVSLWQQALRVFAGLSSMPTAVPVTLTDALSQLRGVLSRQVFQPQTAESALQVLGTLEASGLQFTHLWLTSMSNRNWPPVPSPNPLLPLLMQRTQGMPHASPEREYRYAASLSEQFLRSAQHIVVSSPQTIDENPVKISELFSRFPLCELHEVLGRAPESLLPVREIRRRYLESQKIEAFDAGNAPALAPGAAVKGGSTVFTSQAACPFRAFAKHRLYVERQHEPVQGLSAADRGSLLHRALELFWNSVQTQQQLLACSDDELRGKCERVSQYAVDQFIGRSAKSLGPRFRAIEVARLQKLLMHWMTEEKQRAGFEVVETEQRGNYTFADLSFETRIDRIDRLVDGNHLLIDYKTGRASPADWWSDRPEQPQLPLYAVLLETADTVEQAMPVGGIAFAEISVDKRQLKGAGDDTCIEPLVSWNSRLQQDSGQLNWEQQKLHWRKVLTALATDFIRGRADVDPKHHPSVSARTCQFCHLKSVCRIQHEELVQ